MENFIFLCSVVKVMDLSSTSGHFGPLSPSNYKKFITREGNFKLTAHKQNYNKSMNKLSCMFENVLQFKFRLNNNLCFILHNKRELHLPLYRKLYYSPLTLHVYLVLKINKQDFKNLSQYICKRNIT